MEKERRGKEGKKENVFFFSPELVMLKLPLHKIAQMELAYTSSWFTSFLFPAVNSLGLVLFSFCVYTGLTNWGDSEWGLPKDSAKHDENYWLS